MDLKKFEEIWPSKDLLSELVPPSYLDEILTKLDLLPLELDIFDTKPMIGLFDKDLVLNKLEKMKAYRRLYNHEEAIREGWEILNMLRFKPPYEHKEFLEIWISFLLMWEDSCNWYGYIEGTLGSLWAAKTLRELYRFKEAWHLLNSSASIVSSNIYAIATLKQSKSMMIDKPNLKKDLLNQSNQLLEQSLDYIDLALIRSTIIPVSVWSIRGNLHRKLGKFEEAIKCHSMARKRCKSDESEGIQLSHLGRAKISKGDKQGLNDLREAVKLCKDLPSPSSVRTLKALGQGLIKLKKLDEAAEVTIKARNLARERKFGHQLESIEAMHEVIKNKKEK